MSGLVLKVCLHIFILTYSWLKINSPVLLEDTDCIPAVLSAEIWVYWRIADSPSTDPRSGFVLNDLS
jgi:hypothetical protein